MDPDNDSAEQDGGDATTERLLEALLVEDAAIEWDPVTGKARVAPRRKPELDSPTGSA